jgi:hypothetical protein
LPQCRKNGSQQVKYVQLVKTSPLTEFKLQGSAAYKVTVTVLWVRKSRTVFLQSGLLSNALTRALAGKTMAQPVFCGVP